MKVPRFGAARIPAPRGVETLFGASSTKRLATVASEGHAASAVAARLLAFDHMGFEPSHYERQAILTGVAIQTARGRPATICET